MKTVLIRWRGALGLLAQAETWTSWRMLAYALGNLLLLSYDWLEDHTIGT